MIEQFFSRDTITATRWKNGGGVTREVAKSPSQAPFWRVSIANVDQEGPFSSFVDLDRILTVIEGKGMVLAHKNGDLVADLHIQCTFLDQMRSMGCCPMGQFRTST